MGIGLVILVMALRLPQIRCMVFKLMAKPLYLLLVSMMKTRSNPQDEVDDEVESWVLVNGDEELAAAQEC